MTWDGYITGYDIAFIAGILVGWASVRLSMWGKRHG